MTKTRYQGAILRGTAILLIQHREHAGGHSYWLLPGGGREEGESEEQCVAREMKEETGLEVKVEKLLLDEQVFFGVYQHHKTYQCTILAGEPHPGYEPEPGPSSRYAIVAADWFDLCSEAGWGDKVLSDPYTYPVLKKLQAVLALPPTA